MTQAVTIALIGCGAFGNRLARDIVHDVEGLQLVGVYDVNLESAMTLARHREVEAFASLDHLLGSQSVEAVIVATPHDTHMAVAVAAARAGKHIFCEKPMALTVKECRAMIDAAERYQVKLMVGHKRRLRPEYARLAEIVHSGILGRPLAVAITGFHYSDYYRGWFAQTRHSGGALYCAGVHDLDFLRFICGDVQSVYAVDGPHVSSEHDWADSVFVTLRFRTGAIGGLHVAFTDRLLSFRESFVARIACEKGSACYDPRRIAVTWQRAGGTTEEVVFPEYGFFEAFRRELLNFTRWIRGTAEPLLTAENGMRCVELLEASWRSIEENRPIDLPLASTIDRYELAACQPQDG